MDTIRIDPSRIDLSRIAEPLERLPAAGAAIVSRAGDVAGNLAGQITDHLGDIDVEATARRSRRTIAELVPWMTVGRSSRLGSSRRWLLVGVAALTVAAVVVLRRRRSATSERTTGRDDWSTNSANGSTPAASTTRPDRGAAAAHA